MSSCHTRAAYTITPDLAAGFIEIAISGFWTVEDVDALAADMRTLIRAGGDDPAAARSLYNFTDATIQSQAVVQRMCEHAAHAAFSSRRAALYTEGGLARLQAKRVAEAGGHMRVFPSRADAIAFLLAESAEAPARTR